MIVETPEAIEMLAQFMFANADQNPHDSQGFPPYHRLPDDIQDFWRGRAKSFLRELIYKLRVQP